MVFQILFAGNGVTVIEHLCRVKGKKVFYCYSSSNMLQDKEGSTHLKFIAD
jgi:hypothetical protein